MQFYKTYKSICDRGYQVLGLSTGDSPEFRANPWHFQKASPPSYEAHARYRFLQTVELCKKYQGKRTLEIAAGGGFNAACLVTDNNEVLINDLLPLSDELKNYKTGEKIKFIGGNLFELDPNVIGKFDLVICCEVIEHLAHGDEFMQKVKSLTSRNGHVILTTPNGNYFRSKLPTYSQIEDFSQFEKEQFKPDGDGHLFLYTPKELSDLTRKNQLVIKEVLLTSSPWISGKAMFRKLPHLSIFFPLYYFLDFLFQKIMKSSCTQLIIVAKNESP